ncbi:hypothetical protein, partial [Rhizobium sp. SGZ-381]|uniref:hypothetical protein n=1 Tax=Rhizobium sp. SGZ-381 TaxID=3342800 RepID=UPI0036729766
LLWQEAYISVHGPDALDITVLRPLLPLKRYYLRFGNWNKALTGDGVLIAPQVLRRPSVNQRLNEPYQCVDGI